MMWESDIGPWLHCGPQVLQRQYLPHWLVSQTTFLKRSWRVNDTSRLYWWMSGCSRMDNAPNLEAPDPATKRQWVV